MARGGERKLPQSPRDQVQQRESGRTITQVVQSFSASMWSGPLPPPETLREYEEIIPGSARAIFETAQDTRRLVAAQSEHRMKLEKTVIESDVRSAVTGQWLSFIVMMTAMLIGAYIIQIGKSAEGFATIIAAVGALTGLSIYAVRTRSEERKGKAVAVPTPEAPLPDDGPPQRQLSS